MNLIFDQKELDESAEDDREIKSKATFPKSV